MAFLDPKETIMSITLTDEGRKKLSTGQLQMKFYRFFDDEVDYQTPFEGAAAAAVIPPDPPIDGAVIFGDDEDSVIFGDGEDVVIFGT
jgi:hypothetical protein